MTFFKKVLEIRSKEGVLHFTRWAIVSCKYFNLYIHKISQADKDLHLHSHPWDFVSIILKGSYEESFLSEDCWPVTEQNKYRVPVNNVKKFLTVTKMNSNAFHKVNRIIKGPVYSLFFSYGQRVPWYYFADGTKIENEIYRKMKHSNAWDRKYYQ